MKRKNLARNAILMLAHVAGNSDENGEPSAGLFLILYNHTQVSVGFDIEIKQKFTGYAQNTSLQILLNDLNRKRQTTAYLNTCKLYI